MAMFMPQLREAIMPLHDEAEKRGPLREIPEKTMTLNNYKKILGRLYGFVSASEEVIEPLFASDSVDLDWGERKRVGHLENDLIFLGETRKTLEMLPKCEEVSNIRNMFQALGIVYLFEGSRLGGLVLSKALREHFGFGNYQGYAYFASNGAEVVAMWQTFKNFMENHVASNGGEAEIIISAERSIDLLNMWLNTY